jgi:hypothetical protein
MKIKTHDIITTLLEENGYEIETSSRSIGKIHGWDVSPVLTLWIIDEHVILTSNDNHKERGIKQVLCGSNLCITELHHPNSVDIIQLWLDNLEHLTVVTHESMD